MLKAWNEQPAPRGAEIMASYGVLEPLRFAKVCKHGCCINMGFGSMRLPRYWRLATDEERTAATPPTPEEL